VIAWLSGIVRNNGGEGTLVLDVNGVGYLLTVPTGVAGQHAVGDAIELHVHTHVREDQISLFGFDSAAQVEAFKKLIGVSGIGPKSAVSVLSVLPPTALAQAVETDDIASLKQAQGVGKRVAERIAMELKGKLDGLWDGAGAAAAGRPASAAAKAPVFKDLRSALLNLQYRPKEIDAVFDHIAKAHPGVEEFELLLRAALKHLKKR